MSETCHIRSMVYSDLNSAIQVQRQTFSADLCEDLEVFENRFQIFGQYFQVALIDQQVVGYMLCFPWKLGESPVNNEKFPAKLPLPNCFYVHDITLLEQARGFGIAQKMLEMAKDDGRKLGHRYLSLVSVEQSGDYWDKRGFMPYKDLTPEKVAMLRKIYGAHARLMVQAL